LMYVVLLWQAGVMVLLYVSDRQRVVIVSMMIFFAAAFLDWFLTNIKGKKVLVVVLGLVVLAMFPLLYIENDVMKDERRLWQRYSQANRLMREAAGDRQNGDLIPAVQKNALALAYTPWQIEDRTLSGLRFKGKAAKEGALVLALGMTDKSPSALFDLGLLFIENGNLDRAEVIFKSLAEGGYLFNRQYSQSSLPEFYLARICRLKGEKTTALFYLEKASVKNPGDPWVLAQLFAFTGKPVYKTKISRYFDEIDAQFFLGKALLDTGKPREAVECFSYVVEKLPTYRKALVYLSIALGAAGEYQPAVEHYLKALALSPDPVFREKEVIGIFKAFAAQNPDDEKAQQLLNIVLKQFGY
ncbi:MAG: tetratricopeptide repeat protein, partial [bacterium]|nr:tetratricopeptide repeat protein [bacterium]